MTYKLDCNLTYSHLEGRAMSSSATGFRPWCASITEPLETLPLVDTNEITPGFPADAASTTKLSGAEWVVVRGNLEFTDRLASAVLTSPSRPGVSVALEKLLNQFSRLSTTSVCEPDDPDSGVSIWLAFLYTSPNHNNLSPNFKIR